MCGDDITAEEIQAAKQTRVDALYQLCRRILNECLPWDWKKDVIVPLRKNG